MKPIQHLLPIPLQAERWPCARPGYAVSAGCVCHDGARRVIMSVAFGRDKVDEWFGSGRFG